MTYMLGRFTGYPPHIFESGVVAEIKDSSFRLYIFLTRVSDQKSSREFAILDSAISQRAGISPRSLTGARSELKRVGWIQCERAPGQGYLYRMCDPETGKPFPGDPRTPAPYKKRLRASAGSENKRLVKPVPKAEPLAHPLKEEDGSTSFDFGFNWNKDKSEG
jgi:hypothetical protein